jgi:hypothetical protein
MPASPLTDQDLRRSEEWLGNRRPLAGMMAGLLSPARRRGRGRGEHLTRPRRGAQGHAFLKVDQRMK